MNRHILYTRGGEVEYSAPTLEILTVRVEQGFAATTPDPTYDNSESTEDTGYDNTPGYF